jgi:hypothetical protein
MRAFKFLLLFIIYYLPFDGNGQTISLAFRSGSKTARLDSLVQSEGEQINAYFHAHISFKISEGASFTDRDNHIVYAGLKEIRSFSRMIEAKQFPLLVRLILAHESGHILQRKLPYYSAGNIYLNECQADMYAGNYMEAQVISEYHKFYEAIFKMALHLENPSPDETKRLDESRRRMNKDIETVLGVFFSLGQDFGNTDHPNGMQRRKAANEGFNYGFVSAMDTLALAAVKSFDKDDYTDHAWQVYQEDMLRIAGTFDKQKADDFNSWSLRQAKKIIHFNPELSLYMTIGNLQLKDTSVKGEHYQKFKVGIRNDAPFKISFSALIQGEPQDQLAVKDSELISVPTYGKILSATLAPHTTVILEDSIAYDNGYDTPVLISPLMSDFQYAFDFADTSQHPVSALLPIPLKPKNMIEHLPFMMSQIYNSVKSNCETLRASPFFVEDIRHPENRTCLCYYSDWSISANIVQNKLSKITIVLFEGKGEAKGKAIFTLAKNKISAMNHSTEFQHYTAKVLNEKPGDQGWDFGAVPLLPGIAPHHWQLLYSAPKSPAVNYQIALVYLNKRITDPL